jgi:hypothetical protein
VSYSDWLYADARGSSCGTMQCTVCGNPVVDGRYRYRKKYKHGDWGFQVQHEVCSSSDPKWAEIDAGNAQMIVRQYELSDACKAFKQKWGVTDLDEYIIEATP